jgi:hypothetical protein
MDRDDLLLRLLCALTMLEREGGVESIEALSNLYRDLAALDGTLSSDSIINDIRISVATLSHTLTIQ